VTVDGLMRVFNRLGTLDKAQASCRVQEWPAFMVAWLTEAYRVTKPSGRLALNVPLDTSEPYPRSTYAYAVRAANVAGWEYRSTVVWNEGNTTKGGWALDEAHACIERIKGSLESVRAELFDLREREGWAALGYASFKDCIQDEFQMSEQRAYQLLNAFVVDRILAAPWQESRAFFGRDATPNPDSTMVESQIAVAPIPEAHARQPAVPLADVSRSIAGAGPQASPKTPNGRSGWIAERRLGRAVGNATTLAVTHWLSADSAASTRVRRHGAEHVVNVASVGVTIAQERAGSRRRQVRQRRLVRCGGVTMPPPGVRSL
jgi:hypothetical protein